jgi:imidazolonepropionase
MEPGGSPYGLMTSAAIGITDDKITYLGPLTTGMTARSVRDVGERLITPALVDCHTHAIFGGNRISEFEDRLGGSSYEDLAAAGGGILSTVRATRITPDDELASLAATRLGWLLRSGVGTVEVKSGYGLDLYHELRMLRVARLLGRQGPQRVTTSLLAAHTTPPGHFGVADRYVTEICERIIPAAAAEGLADTVDGFCETIAFSADQIGRVFDAALAAGLSVRLHADQLTDGGGAALAAEYGALSADHLEHASVSGLDKMARAGTVAVLIPGASVFLNEPAVPNIPAMRVAGVAMALSTDLNPGTSPVASLQAAMWLATSRFRLTPEESLAGTTRNAAKALGLSDTGIVRVGMRADLALWRTTEPAALSYWTGAPLCQAVWVAGSLAYEAIPDD